MPQDTPGPRAATGPPSAGGRLHSALAQLDRALDTPRREGVALGNWRWTVRQRMTAVRDLLAHEPVGPQGSGGDGWLAARGGVAFREREGLLLRLGAAGQQVLEAPDAEAVRGELKRLLVDVSHHLQRVRDLAYDEVELELGGSE